VPVWLPMRFRRRVPKSCSLRSHEFAITYRGQLVGTTAHAGRCGDRRAPDSPPVLARAPRQPADGATCLAPSPSCDANWLPRGRCDSIGRQARGKPRATVYRLNPQQCWKLSCLITRCIEPGRDSRSGRYSRYRSESWAVALTCAAEIAALDWILRACNALGRCTACTPVRHSRRL
jgi:hypothetical protein